MRSSGFGLGKKQSRGDEPKRQPPTSTDLTQLLASSQKNPDKTFTVAWLVPNKPNCIFTLSVNNCGSAQRDRRGWSSSAIDNSAIGEAEWKLFQDTDSLRSEIFSMRTSDAYLVHTMLEENSMASGTQSPVTAMPASVAALSYADAPQEFHAPSPYDAPQPTPGVQEGSLRMTKIRALLESFNQKQATGRLICDIGTVQAEVFLTGGEPVHAKSSHSISQGRDLVGDAALIDLLTWTDGTYKFQEGWPAASKTIHHPLQGFLEGAVVPQAPPVAPPVGAPTMGSASQAASYQPAYSEPEESHSAAPPQRAQAAPQPVAAPRNFTAGSPDDFSQVDDLIGDIYVNLVESSGLLKYGMFLMLVRSEFVRHEKGKQPFSFASIELELPQGMQLTDAALGKIGERFEKLCLPLDTLTYAGQGRFYALFPQQESIPVSTLIKQFMNNVQAIPLDQGLHGSAIKVTAGLSEIPRDGADFQRIFNHANGLRGQATQAKKIVSSSF